MSDTPSVLAELLAECDAHGIHLFAADAGVLEIDAPQDALTPDLLGRLKANKPGLLAALGYCPDCGGALRESPTFDGFLNNECPTCDRCFGCRPESDKVAERFKSKGEPVAIVDTDDEPLGEVSACPSCGSLDQWQTMAGNWRCLRCDAPATARRLREMAAPLKMTTQRN